MSELRLLQALAGRFPEHVQYPAVQLEDHWQSRYRSEIFDVDRVRYLRQQRDLVFLP